MKVIESMGPIANRSRRKRFCLLIATDSMKHINYCQERTISADTSANTLEFTAVPAHLANEQSKSNHDKILSAKTAQDSPL